MAGDGHTGTPEFRARGLDSCVALKVFVAGVLEQANIATCIIALLLHPEAHNQHSPAEANALRIPRAHARC